jgi:YVTN family beta-propeller protein
MNMHFNNFFIAALFALSICRVAMASGDTAYVSNENGGITVIDLATLKVTKDFDIGGKGPRGLALTDDGKYLLTANQGSNDLSAIDTRTGAIVHRVALGPRPEFMKIFGNFAYVTCEPGGMRAEEVKDRNYLSEAAAQIAVVDLKSWKVVNWIKSRLETEGLEFSADGKNIITTNEGDETVSVYDRISGANVKTVDTAPYGKRPRGITRTPDNKGYVVTMEGSSNVVIFDTAFNVIKSTPTKEGPNGVAFDPSGKLLLVAAARASTLQIFDAKTLLVVAEAPIGKRCWHFTYTPDRTSILVSCGRTNDVRVLDAKTYEPISMIPDLKLPWGIVTYPPAHGTLDSPRMHD